MGNIYYTIICGRFPSKTNAIMLQNRLYKNGFASNILYSYNYYKVQIGVYYDINKANDMVEKLLSKGFDVKIENYSLTK